MNSTTLLIILAAVVVCVVALVIFSRSKKDSAAAKKEDAAEAGTYAPLAQGILNAIGGKDNVISASYCTTRLSFEVKNYNRVDEKAVKEAGAAGLIRPAKNSCQVIIGKSAKSVYSELNKLLK